MSWKNRIVDERDVPPGDLVPNPQNWRRHPNYQLNALQAVLDEVGWVQRVIVNETTGRLIDGHARVAQSIAQNEPLVPVIYVRLSEDEENLVLATLDPISALAQSDIEAQRELIDSVETENESLINLIASMRISDPEFKPGDGDDQGHLDQLNSGQEAGIVCPKCGHEW